MFPDGCLFISAGARVGTRFSLGFPLMGNGILIKDINDTDTWD